MTDENNTIFDLATKFINETSEHVFLTGKAGTGKTTFLRHIRQHTHKHTVVAAPTGVAAINAGGVTLHSLFQLPFEPFVPGASTNKNLFRFGKAKLDLLHQLELLIIDEVSMLRADVLDAIDHTLQRVRRSSKPFGGVQVLYIGDMFQLPPVAKDDEWELLKNYYESTFFFHSHAVRKTQPVYLELKKVYRQSEQTFIDLLNNVRNNCLTPADLERLNARYRPGFESPAGEKYITLTTHNSKADRMNEHELAKLPAEERVFEGEVQGDFPDYALPTDRQLRLKVGAQVMFIKNDPAGNYFNGKIAEISRIAGRDVYAYLSDTNKEIPVHKEEWSNKRYKLNKETGAVEEDELGSYKQLPLRLAWAVTIHKSQGLTFDKAIVDIGASFAAGQAYVALSRCTSLDGIVLRSRMSPDCILTDEYALNYSRSEKAESELQQLLSEGRRKYWAERLLLYFDWKKMHRLLWDFQKVLDDKTSGEFNPARELLLHFKHRVAEFETVSQRFCQQLQHLMEKERLTGDLAELRERCRSAVNYFYENVGRAILQPLQEFSQHAKLPKNAKTFRKYIDELEKDIVCFLENMKQVRYNNVPFAEDMMLELPKKQDIFEEPEKPKKEKGNTQRATLKLFNEGHSVEEIAALRALAVSTIESHLAPHIGKEVPVSKFFTNNEIVELLPLVQPLLELESPSFKDLFTELGGQYSYGRLRMLFSYFKNIREN